MHIQTRDREEETYVDPQRDWLADWRTAVAWTWGSVCLHSVQLKLPHSAETRRTSATTLAETWLSLNSAISLFNESLKAVGGC